MAASKKKHNLRLWQVEQQLFGLDHGAVGGALAAKWNFPLMLSEAIGFHHWPTFANQSQRLAAVINVADAWANAEVGGKAHFGEAVYHAEAPCLLDVNDATLQRIHATVRPDKTPPKPQPEVRRGFFGLGRRAG